MQITRKDFFIGSVAATAAIGLKAAEQKPLSNIQGFKWTSGITKTLLIAYHLPFTSLSYSLINIAESLPATSSVVTP